MPADEISAKKPKPKADMNDHLSVVELLLSLSKSTRGLVSLKLALVNFYNGQDELLLLLKEGKPQSTSILAAKLSVRPSTVSKTVDRLAAKGLLARAIDETDGRRTLIALTPLGVEALIQLHVVREQLETELTAGLLPEKLDEVVRSLRLMEGQLQRRLLRVRI